MADAAGAPVASDAAPPQPVADAPSGDYDFEDPGTSAFDSVAGSATPPAAPAPAASTTPDPSAPAAPVAPATGTTPAPAAQPAASTTDVATAPAADQAAAAATAAAPAPTSNNQAAAAVAPAAPQITQEQVNRAAQLGWSPEVLQNFADPEKGLLQAENLAMRAHMVARQQFGQPQQTPAQQPAQQPVPAQQPAAAPGPFDENAVRQAWINAGYDESVANLQVESARQLHAVTVQNHELRTWAGNANQALQNLTTFTKQQAEQAQAREQAQMAEHIGQVIDRDFADFKKTLPPSIASGIDEKQQQQIYGMAEAIVTMHNARRTPMPDNPTLFRQAAQAVIPAEKWAAAAREQVAQQVKNHQDLGIARPTSGGQPPRVPGDQAAASFAEQWWAQNVGATGNGAAPPDV